MPNKPIKDISGKRFGKLIAIKRVPVSGGAFKWLCKCDCGNKTKVPLNALQGQHPTHSCGCLRKESKTITHGLSKTYEYARWWGLITRCYNPNVKNWDRYGGRGITVCEEWRTNPENFITWFKKQIGRRNPKILQIDRIDNDGPYSPENCRLITSKWNNNNRNNNVKYLFGGKEYTLADLIDQTSVVKGPTFKNRLYNSKWTIERSILTPTANFYDRIDKSFGLHFMMEGYDVEFEKLLDISLIKKFLAEMPEYIGMKLISGPDVFYYEGSGEAEKGVTGISVLATSHCSIHTFPRQSGFFSFDVYSCKAFDPYKAFEKICEYFDPQRFEIKNHIRGFEYPHFMEEIETIQEGNIKTQIYTFNRCGMRDK